MNLSALVKAIKGSREINVGEDRQIDSLCIDSRKAGENSLFFCLTGGAQDSHAFAEAAVGRGAVAVVTERALPLDVPQILVKDGREALSRLASVFYGEPSTKLCVIGVTGTNGKTTVTYMLESILRVGGKKVGRIGTLGIAYGDIEKENPLTTPDPIALQEALAEMVNSGVEYVVMEVSAHALYYKKTAGVRFQACVFTNLSTDHLDFFHHMQAYRQAKLKLFSKAVCPLAVVNGDEETGREICKLRQKTGGKTTVYGLTTPADAFAIITSERLDGSECMFNVNDKLCRVSLSFCGRHNVYNALAAATCAVELGIETGAIAQGLAKLKRVKGRIERVANFHGGEIYVDFAHTPDGLERTLQSLRPHCKGRLLCLFGCGGNRDRAKRPLMGEIAGKKSDFSVLTSDNPRYEDPLDILTEIERGYRRFSSRYVVVPDRERAINYALEILREGDILVIAGKGGEETQEIMGIKYPFNDQDKVVKLLRQKGEFLS